MKKLLLSIGLALCLLTIATAKTPPEVLTPYKAYRAALKAGDNSKAQKHAYEAWQKAEKLLGDHKLTGDLAANFSDMPRSNPSPKVLKRWMKGYDRAISLAKYHENDAVDIELERHIKRLQTGVSILMPKNRKMVPIVDYKHFTAMEEALELHSKTQSVFAGDMEVLRLKYFTILENWDKGLDASQRAEAIYKVAPKDIPSPYRSVLPLYIGDMYSDMSESLLAALSYQKMFHGPSSNAVPKAIQTKARSSWMKNWLKVEQAGNLQMAKDRGLCDCTPKEGTDGGPVPIIRIPPSFAPKAERSGVVYVLFDLNVDGAPKDIQIAASTEKLFEKFAINGVSKWRYTPISARSNTELRQGIFARIDYKLKNGRGELLPAKPLKASMAYPKGLDALKESSAIVVTGSRIVRSTSY